MVCIEYLKSYRDPDCCLPTVSSRFYGACLGICGGWKCEIHFIIGKCNYLRLHISGTRSY